MAYGRSRQVTSRAGVVVLVEGTKQKAVAATGGMLSGLASSQPNEGESAGGTGCATKHTIYRDD
jgi:hypothetical protein